MRHLPDLVSPEPAPIGSGWFAPRISRIPVKASQRDRVLCPICLGGGESGTGLHQSPRDVIESTEGVVAIWPEEATEGDALLPLARITVDATKQEVLPTTVERSIGRQAFGLDVFNR